jgi:hypothetical protein
MLPRLFLYVARDVPVCAILCRGNRKKEFEWIKWNMMTDTFTKEQWLVSKMTVPTLCSIQPDGERIGYIYYNDNVSYIVKSKFPNMTEEYVEEYEGYYFYGPYPKEDGGHLITAKRWIDPRGRTITTNKGILYADGKEIYKSVT